MAKVYLTNRTSKPIKLIDWHGAWTDKTKSTVINAYSIGFYVGTVAEPGIGRNRAWVGLQSAFTVGPDLQAYVSVGSEGAWDYAIQFYDGGKNRDDKTVMGTEAVLHDGPDDDSNVYLTIDYTFDPWMSRIPDSKRLFEVTVPGTHDSATYELPQPSNCQDTSIEEQLYMGVRHFDIRLDADSSRYPVVHGSTHGGITNTTKYDLADIAAIMYGFLINPTAGDSRDETVVLQIKIDRGGDDPKTNRKIIDIIKNVFGPGNIGHLYLQPMAPPAPTMKDLRGKLVVLRRFELAHENATYSCTPIKYFAWGALHYAWTQGGSSAAPWKEVFRYNRFEWPDGGASPKDYVNRNGMGFVIQDDYGLQPLPKALTTMAFLDAAVSGAYDGDWYLNFSSTSEPRPSGAAAVVNPMLVHFLATKPNRPQGHGYGTLLMDFANLELVRALVEKNF